MATNDDDDDPPELRGLLAELDRRQRRVLAEFLAEQSPEVRERLAARLCQDPSPQGVGEEFAALLVAWANQGRTRRRSRLRYVLVWYAKHALHRLSGKVPDAERASAYLRRAMESAETTALDEALQGGWKVRRSLDVLGNRQWQRFRSWLSPEQTRRFQPYLAALMPAAVVPLGDEPLGHGSTASAVQSASSRAGWRGPAGAAAVVVGVPLLVVGLWYLVRGSNAPPADGRETTKVPEPVGRSATGPRPTLDEPAAPDAGVASLPGGPLPDDGRSRLMWTRHRVGETRPLSDVAWSPELGQAVVVGRHGAMWRARGVDDWTPVSQPRTYSHDAVAYGAGRYVAVGSTEAVSRTGRLISTSTDGVTWEAQIWRDRTALTGVAYAEGVWIAVGNMGTILRSTDAVNWEAIVVPSDSNINRVVFLEGRFVLGGGPGVIWTSTDGRTWSAATIEGTEHAKLVSFHRAACISAVCAAAAHGSAIALGRPSQPWTVRRIALKSSQSLIAVDDLLFLATEEQGLLRSSDGVTWTEEIPAAQQPKTSGLGWTGRWMIAVGFDGSIFTGVPRR